jgi:hypothetical protein
MAPYAYDFLIMQGLLAPAASANPGFTRLYRTSVSDYVELNQDDIQPGSGPFQDNQIATYTVPIESRLFPTGYASFAPPPPNVPIKPPHPIKRLIEPIHVPYPFEGVYTAGDGTTLTATKNAAGQITGFTGTSKDNKAYSLSIQNALINSPGRDALDVQWYNITASMMEGTEQFDDGLNFGFSYCPWANFLEIFLAKDGVEAGIRIDLAAYSPATASVPAVDTMIAQRNFWFNDNPYSAQQATISDTQGDPEIYLPVVAGFWPYLDRLAYFLPAIQRMSASSTVDLAPVATPINSFANCTNLSPSLFSANTQQQFADTVVSAIGPAIGPFAASFISQTETQALALHYLALWLGGITANGFGNADFIAELNYFYAQVILFRKENNTLDPTRGWPGDQQLPPNSIWDWKAVSLGSGDTHQKG